MRQSAGLSPRLAFPNCDVVIIADGPAALVEVCGISLLERLLRNLQRLGFRRATIWPSDSEQIAEGLAKPSWARSELVVSVLPVGQTRASLESLADKLLLASASCYVDPRLLRALALHGEPAVLIDSDPPPELLPLLASTSRTKLGWFSGAALVEKGRVASHREHSLFDRIIAAAEAGELEVVDVQKEPNYVMSLRRDVRPLWFPAPSPQEEHLAENLLLDAAQNGTLDFPAKLHAPIETWIIRRLCQTRITPIQITLFTAAVSALTTFLFASGHLIPGIILALAIGVLDGLDGKQARVKVETTELGKREHVLDYALELSWWTALAFHFASVQRFPKAYVLLGLLVVSDLLDRFAKSSVKKQTGRNLDDVSEFDRLVRLIGGRRNIYVWMLAAGLALGVADKAFLCLCAWGAVTAAIHVLRAFAIRLRQQRIA